MLAIAGGSGREGAVAEFIRTELGRAGAKPSALKSDRAHGRIPQGGEVGNLILTLPGTWPGPRRLLSAHMDTVPLCAGALPKLRGGYVVPASKSTALGGDDRAGATAILVAAAEILRRRLPHPPLVFLWTVQEELGLLGAAPANRTAGPPAAGVQLRRRFARRDHARSDRRLPDADSRHGNRQPRRRRPGEGRQRHRHRRSGDCPVAP